MLEHSCDPRTGVIFDIQRYSIHDGSGIRTLVFLKGCPLRCAWCCNPESQSFAAELAVNPARCIRCGLCAKACPAHAIPSQVEGSVTPDRGRCQACGACVDVCPMAGRTLHGRVVTVNDVISTVERDYIFYRTSGGGVTLSGGEPLLQALFAADLLQACQERGINTAIETCGYAPWDEFAGVLAHTDTVLFDIKHVDGEAHRRLTGVDNALILENLRRAADQAGHVVLRMPLIPECNAEPATVRAIAELARDLHISEMHLLPYHGLGEAKYAALGKCYPLAGLHHLSPEIIHDLKEVAEAVGNLTVTVGG